VSHEIRTGDALEMLRAMPAESVDAIVTDPPYHLTTGKKGGSGSASVSLKTPYGRARVTAGFMGMKWDGGDIAQQPELWSECLRVLKPGGHLLAFSGTRTQHRMVCAIEDGGFEVRDMIAWIYGSGFPKSRNFANDLEDGAEWQGWGTALKPALEPITLARKPLIGTVATNVLSHGTGAINIDRCRIEPSGESRPRINEPSQGKQYRESGSTNFSATPGPRGGAPLGRWPANLIHDGSADVVALFPETTSGAMKREVGAYEGEGVTGFLRGRSGPSNQHGDRGSAARFFYCAKASKSDREVDNNHPTVKPTDLMRYLCRLITPPGGLILDPFMGSGSTGKAAILEGFRFIGIDREPAYVEIAKRRVQFAFDELADL